jgi:hypothetical protein
LNRAFLIADGDGGFDRNQAFELPPIGVMIPQFHVKIKRHRPRRGFFIK